MRLLILLALLGGTLWLVRMGLRDAKKLRRQQGGQAAQDTEKLVQDPVCKAYIPEHRAIRWQHEGTTHHFCSDRCANVYRDEHG